MSIYKLYKDWKSENVRKEDIMTPTFVLIDNSHLITPSVKNALYDYASLPFALGKYNSIANILNDLKIEVHVCDEILTRENKLSNKFFEDAKGFWREKLQSKDCAERAKAERAIREIEKECGYISKSKLRGLYLPSKKMIKLFPKEMETEYEGDRMNELLVTTLVHETMHAYFDRPENRHNPYAYFVEEPMAEFGMLVYLRETDLSDDILKWAKDDVARKQSCYHYGATLYDQYSTWNPFLRKYLEEYKYSINEFEMLDVKNDGTTAGLPCPIPVRTLGVGRTITTTTSGTCRFYCEARSKWYPIGRENVYFHVAERRMVDYSNFCVFYTATRQVFLTFMNKTGHRISGLASFYAGRKNFFPVGNLIDEYRKMFGRVDGVRFKIYEVKPSMGATYAEWIAEEL